MLSTSNCYETFYSCGIELTQQSVLTMTGLLLMMQVWVHVLLLFMQLVTGVPLNARLNLCWTFYLKPSSTLLAWS